MDLWWPKAQIINNNNLIYSDWKKELYDFNLNDINTVFTQKEEFLREFSGQNSDNYLNLRTK